MDVAIFGAGKFGWLQARILAAMPEFDLVGVADTEPGRAAALCDEVGGRPFERHGDLLDEVRAELVVICTPHCLHIPQACDAVDCGRHVVIEKPVAATLEQIDCLLELDRTSKCVVRVGHHSRFQPYVMALKELVRHGALGKIVACWSRFHRNYFHASRPAWFLDPAMAGGGIGLNLVIHRLDAFCTAMDTDILSVSGRSGRAVPDRKVEDYFVMNVDFANGCAGVMIASGLGEAAPETAELIGTEGAAKFRRDHVELYRNGTEGETVPLTCDADGHGVYNRFYRAVLSDISTGSRDAPDTEYATMLAKSVLMAYSANGQCADPNSVVGKRNQSCPSNAVPGDT